MRHSYLHGQNHKCLPKTPGQHFNSFVQGSAISDRVFYFTVLAPQAYYFFKL